MRRVTQPLTPHVAWPFQGRERGVTTFAEATVVRHSFSGGGKPRATTNHLDMRELIDERETRR